MIISELIERLEEYRDIHGDDAEVRLMTQQNWPFENSIRGVCSDDEMAGVLDCDDADDDDEDEEISGTVYIVEGEQLCYGRKAAWEVCGN